MSVFTELEVYVQSRVGYHGKLLKLAEENNGGVAPTVGSDGRLHAPKDGYVWLDGIFGGGQYLPEEDTQQGYKPATTRFKIYKADESTFFMLFSELTEIAVKTGKAWEQNGMEVCYLWVTGAKSVVDNIDEITAEIKTGKYLSLVEDAPANHGAEFKFNMRKINGILRSSAWEYLLEAEGLHTVPFDLNDKTNKFETPWKGQQVCFVYPVGVVEC